MRPTFGLCAPADPEEGLIALAEAGVSVGSRLLRCSQQSADVQIGVRGSGPGKVHCLVGMPGWETNGHIEDPSKRLGMGGAYTSKI